MNTFAIPATTPPSTSPTAQAANAALPIGQHFDDTLKRAQPEAHARADDGGAEPHTHKGAGASARQRKSESKHDDTSSQPGTPAAAMIAPTQQPLAATNKTPPIGDKTSAAVAASIATKNIATAAASVAPRGASADPATTPVMSKLPLSAQPVRIPAPLVPVQDIAGLAPAPTVPAGKSTGSADASADEPVPSTGLASPDANQQATMQAILQAAAQGNGARPDDDKDSGLASNPQANSFIAHLAQLAAGTHAGAPAIQTPPLQLIMQSTPGQPQFMQEAAQQVAWLAGNGIQRAEIQLNPHKLGPIQVEITTHHDRVDVSFAVSHPQTVHALQQTLPQLTDMLAQQGLNLGNASVGQQASGQQQPAYAQHDGRANAVGNIGGVEPESTPGWRTLRLAAPGKVDDFA